MVKENQHSLNKVHEGKEQAVKSGNVILTEKDKIEVIKKIDGVNTGSLYHDIGYVPFLR